MVIHIETNLSSGWSWKLESPCWGNKICLNGVLTKFNDVWTQKILKLTMSWPIFAHKLCLEGENAQILPQQGCILIKWNSPILHVGSEWRGDKAIDCGCVCTISSMVGGTYTCKFIPKGLLSTVERTSSGLRSSPRAWETSMFIPAILDDEFYAWRAIQTWQRYSATKLLRCACGGGRERDSPICIGRGSWVDHMWN